MLCSIIEIKLILHRSNSQSTYSERDSICKELSNLNTYLTARNVNNMVTHLDLLKIKIRQFNVRPTYERLEEFEDVISSMQRNITEQNLNHNESKAILESIKSLLNEAEEKNQKFLSELNEIKENKLELESTISETESNREKIESLLAEDVSRSNEINELLTESRSNKGIIDSFSKRVEKRESQLEKQQAETEKYNNQLEEYTTERKNVLDEAKALIDSAKLALEYKTAEGLSAAFSSKYNDLKNAKSAGWWLAGASAFLILCIAMGIWVFVNKEVSFEAILGRITLIPIFFSGAWFCASQYVKHKNLAEDYAYKSVLAKSMVGFSDQLSDSEKKGEEYSHYIKSVLAEMHKDPLRKRKFEKPRNQKEELEGLIKIIGVIKENL